jgi:hypothetical protein
MLSLQNQSQNTSDAEAHRGIAESRGETTFQSVFQFFSVIPVIK